MRTRDAPPRSDALVRARTAAGRRLTPDEVEAALAVPVGDAEREDVLSLVAWFRQRYPTAADRLAYVRRAYRRWTSSAAGE